MVLHSTAELRQGPAEDDDDHDDGEVQRVRQVYFSAPVTTTASRASVTSDFVPATVTRVVVTDFDMPFGSMVMFMVKWALASIPAFLVLGLVAIVLFALTSMR